ncbi:MAG: proline dehydrogenase [Candidatus Marinamargulisbacteria bacterium]|jgi:proline dehydrogenase
MRPLRHLVNQALPLTALAMPGTRRAMSSKTPTPVSFTNHTEAFKGAPTGSLLRELFLFKVFGTEALKYIGPPAIHAIVKHELPIAKQVAEYFLAQQFSGGRGFKETLPVIQRLAARSVGTVLDLASEGQTTDLEFEETLRKTREMISFSSGETAVQFVAIKATGLTPFESLKTGATLPPAFKARLAALAHHALNCRQSIFIDAEQSQIQGAIREAGKEVMATANKTFPTVWPTYQAYLVDCESQLREDIQWARNLGVMLPLKLVRGAYMGEEREVGKTIGEDIVFPNKAETDACYDACMAICMENLDIVHLYAGTHNQNSLSLLLSLMEKHNIPDQDPRVRVGQLLGMGDHLTFNIAKRVCATKYVPYGPMEDGLSAYLMRRSAENWDLFSGAKTESALRTREIFHRMKISWTSPS